MGIRLDWEVEADNRSIRGTGEDPNAKRARRTALYRLLLTIAILFAIGAGVVYLVIDRVNDVNDEIERILRDTVESEVTALRIGNLAAFQDYQRSASDVWIREQLALFDAYQDELRSDETLQLTGTILDIEIDDPRARVTVQEIQGGVPYTRLWFYYRFEEDTDSPPDGIADAWQWYHVPPDTEFWGEPATLDGEFVTVNYQSVDAELAEAVQTRLDTWLTLACVALPCTEVPPITVEITSNDLPEIDWAVVDPWRLQIESPLRDRARTDMPFSPEMRLDVASLLAVRLVTVAAGADELVPASDAYYLRNEAILPWLVGQFIEVNTGETVIESLAQNYGPAVIGDLLQALSPEANISILTQVTGVSLDQMNIDWRDYFTWLLRLEQQWIAEGQSNQVVTLYDDTDTTAIQAVNTRLAQGPLGVPIQATLVQATAPAADGAPQLMVTVRTGIEDNFTETETIFRLRDNRWKRAN